MCEIYENSAVKIAVRERPIIDLQSIVSYNAKSEKIIVVGERPFAFDFVMDPQTSQQELFSNIIQPLVAKVKEGFNCTALAYGQTGTGKSYTMGLDTNKFEGDHVGIAPRCLKEFFITHDVDQFEVRVSFIEIYNEKVYDLLSENNTDPIPARGFKSSGGTPKIVTNLEECYGIIRQGAKHRHVRPTKMNTQSSRSHAIFTMHVTNCSTANGISSSLNLVDLAGSEGVRRTGHQGLALSEGVHINQGLLSIGKVLSAMTLGSKVIPYRDSVISTVLQDSLNANSYLTLLACISPRREDLSETLSTLRFAQNAKQLKHDPHVNTIMTSIKKSYAKTPFKAPPLQVRNGQQPIAHKRLFSNISNLQAKPTKANTFCTPTKQRHVGAIKFNHSEMGLTPQAKASNKLLNVPYIPQRRMPPPYPFEQSVLPETLFDRSGESHVSLMSPNNVSTSTTIDAPSSSYSPVVRKCITEMGNLFENKIQQIMENITNVNQTQVNAVSSAMNGISRQELKSIMQELLAEGGTQARTNNATEVAVVTPFSRKVSQNQFAAKSSVFNIAEEQSIIEFPSSACALEEDNFEVPTHSSTYVEPTVTDLPKRRSRRISARYVDSSIDPKLLRKSLRCSMRITQSILNRSSSDDPIQITAPKRRTSLRRSVKALHDQKRRSIRLAAHLEVPEPTKEHKKGKPSKAEGKHVNNSIIDSYFKGTVGKNKPKNRKKSSRTEHRTAILNLLNTGSIKELQVLPHIGQKTAYQLITQRILNGKFKNLAAVEKLPIWRGSSWERFAEANILT